MYILLVIGKEVKQSYLKLLASGLVFVFIVLNEVSITVRNDGISDLFLDVSMDLTVLKSHFFCIFETIGWVTNLDFIDTQISLCKSSCLSNTDIVEHTTNLYSLQIFD